MKVQNCKYMTSREKSSFSWNYFQLVSSSGGIIDQVFSEGDNYVFCNDVSNFMQKLGVLYDASQWRLFIDSSKTSLKGVLLHNSNEYASIPIAHSFYLKKLHENMKTSLEAIEYEQYEWQICRDFKVLSILLGKQLGFTKYPCFLCLWDSRNRKRHYVRKEWPLRVTIKSGDPNILNKPMIDP